MAERVGFEPTAPFSVTGFQDRLLKPLGHLSKHTENVQLSIANCVLPVNLQVHAGFRLLLWPQAEIAPLSLECQFLH